MPFVEPIWVALAQIRVQKLKSFFTLLGVCIGVMFLIAVISIVQGMSSYMENDFAAKLLGVNTFTLRRFPWFGDGASSEEEWRTWLRRPRIYHSDLALVASVLPPGTRYAVESQEFLQAQSQYARPKQLTASSLHESTRRRGRNNGPESDRAHDGRRDGVGARGHARAAQPEA